MSNESNALTSLIVNQSTRSFGIREEIMIRWSPRFWNRRVQLLQHRRWLVFKVWQIPSTNTKNNKNETNQSQDEEVVDQPIHQRGDGIHVDFLQSAPHAHSLMNPIRREATSLST